MLIIGDVSKFCRRSRKWARNVHIKGIDPLLGDETDFSANIYVENLMINKNKGETNSGSEHQIKQQAWHKEEPKYIVSMALGNKGDEEGEHEVVKRGLANK